TGDQFGVTGEELNLGALDNYGGPTKTHALFLPSVAIDMGDDCVADSLHCGDPNLPQLLTDQRGTLFPRKEGSHVDVGSFESQPPPPTPSASPTATPTASPTPCAETNTLADPGLESSSGNGPITNSKWESTSTKFGSSLCSTAVCGNGSNGQAVPRTGKFWAWFGGSEGPENGTLKQKVLIPSGAVMFIGYYLKISKVYAPFADTLTITVDGEAIQTITEPTTEETAYSFHAVPVPAVFADGGLHTIGFGFDAPNTGKVSSFNLDDITFDVTCPPVSTGGTE